MRNLEPVPVPTNVFSKHEPLQRLWIQLVPADFRALAPYRFMSLNLHRNLALNLFFSGSLPNSSTFFSYMYTQLVPYTHAQHTHMHTTHTHTHRCVSLAVMFLLNIFKFIHAFIVPFPTKLVAPEKCKENILPHPTVHTTFLQMLRRKTLTNTNTLVHTDMGSWTFFSSKAI